MLVFGIHAVTAKLKQLNHEEIAQAEVLIDRNRKDKRIQECVELAKNLKVKIKFVTPKKLDNLINGNHQGIIISSLSIAKENPDLVGLIKSLPHPALLLILDGITDPHNLGACLRTSDGAGVDVVITPQNNAASITPVVNKVASGANVPFYQVRNLARTINQLKDLGIQIIGTDDQADTSIFEVDLTQATAIVLGNEGSGLRRLTKQSCQHLVTIPMAGAVTNLNVSVACGVTLYQAVNCRLFGG